MNELLPQVNHWLDRFGAHAPNPQVRLLSRRLPLWGSSVVGGALVGVILQAGLAAAGGRSFWSAFTFAVAVGLILLGLAWLRRLFSGREDYTLYTYQLLALLAACGLCLALRLPLLPHLDGIALAFGVATVFGRLGCLAAGCCYGLPARVGVCYPSHAPSPRARLLPLPLLEAFWTLVWVAWGSLSMLAHSQPGLALTAYLTGYAAGRFVLEFFRGDERRQFVSGVPAAQIVAVGVAVCVAVAEWMGLLPLTPYHLALAGALAAVCAFLLFRGLENKRWAGADQQLEIQGFLPLLEAPAESAVQPPPVFRTSTGLLLSGGYLLRQRRRHITFSRRGKPLSHRQARLVAAMLIALVNPSQGAELLHAGNGVYHLLLPV